MANPARITAQVIQFPNSIVLPTLAERSKPDQENVLSNTAVDLVRMTAKGQVQDMMIICKLSDGRYSTFFSKSYSDMPITAARDFNRVLDTLAPVPASAKILDFRRRE